MNRFKVIMVASAMSMVAVSCSPKGETTTSSTSTTPATENSSVAAKADIAYVNMDSLYSKYQMAIDLGKEFEAKQKKAEGDLSSRSKGFEKEAMSFQDKVQKGLVTRAQAETMAADLQKKEASLYEYRDQMTGQLAEEQQVMLNQIHHSILEFMAEFNSDYRYGVILTTSNGTPILNANPAFDITSLVIEGINKKYAAEKTASK